MTQEWTTTAKEGSAEFWHLKIGKYKVYNKGEIKLSSVGQPLICCTQS